MNTIGEFVPDAVMSPGDDVTVYEMIAAPPFELGGENDIVALSSPATACTASGAVGSVVVELLPEYLLDPYVLSPYVFANAYPEPKAKNKNADKSIPKRYAAAFRDLYSAIRACSITSAFFL